MCEIHGRLLITFLLCAEGVLRQPMLYLSLHFKQHRDEYYRLLQHVRETGDWESWLRFFLEGVIFTSAKAMSTATRLLALFKEDHNRLTGESATVLRLHQWMQRHPISSATAAGEKLGVSHPTANRALKKMTDLGVLKEITGGDYARLYAYSGYLDILNDFEGAR